MVIINIQGNDNAFVPNNRLVTAIADVLKTKEDCFPSDLKQNFSDEELSKHWGISYALAHVTIMES